MQKLETNPHRFRAGAARPVAKGTYGSLNRAIGRDRMRLTGRFAFLFSAAVVGCVERFETEDGVALKTTSTTAHGATSKPIDYCLDADFITSASYVSAGTSSTTLAADAWANRFQVFSGVVDHVVLLDEPFTTEHVTELHEQGSGLHVGKAWRCANAM